MAVSFAIVVALSASTVLLSYLYSRRWNVVRPPIGLMNGFDIVVIAAGIAVAPLLYLTLPLWAMAVLTIPSGVGVAYLTLEPVLRRKPAVWTLALLLLGADLVAAARYGLTDNRYLAVNDVLIALVVIGVATLWTQGGMKARHAAALVAVLTVYDIVATSGLPLMTNLIGQVTKIPMAPLLAWNVAGTDLAVGAGDLVVAVTFTLAMRKGYGRAAGTGALLLSVAGVTTALTLVTLGVVDQVIPAMAVLGPLLLAHYGWWRRRVGTERTMRQYLAAEPVKDRHVALT
jgi:hypothetical protein